MPEGPSHLKLCRAPAASSGTAAGSAGLEELFGQYSKYVATIAFRILGRDEEVDDVVQDVFVEAVGCIGTLRDPGSIKGWLATVTVRCASRRLRRRRLRGFLGLDDAPDYRLAVDEGAAPEQRELLSRIYAVLDGMNVKDRIAWVLRYLEEENLEDVALLCGCSLATAKRRISSAQKAIIRGLGDEV